MRPTGRMNVFATFQSPTRVADGQGGFSETWADTVTSVPIAIESRAETETLQAAQITAGVARTVTAKFSEALAAVLPTWRISVGAKTLEIHAVTNLDARNRQIQFLCTEVQVTA